MAVRFGSSGDSRILHTLGAGGAGGLPLGGWTVALRFRIQTDTNSFAILYAAIDPGGNGNNLFLGSDGTTLTMHSDSGGTDITPISCTVGVWYEIIGVNVGTNDSRLFYAAEGETTLNKATTASWTVPTTANVGQTIGSDSFADTFKGDMEHVRGWSVALTDEEVQSYWDSGRDPRPDFLDFWLPLSSPSTVVEDFGTNSRPYVASGTIGPSDPHRSDVGQMRKRRPRVLRVQQSAVVFPPMASGERPGLSSRISLVALSSISGARELLPLAAPTPGIQFYPESASVPRGVPRLDPGGAGSSAPIVPAATTPVGTSWWQAPPEIARRRLYVDPAGSAGVLQPVASGLTPLSWSVPSPILVRSPSAADGGGGAISPLNPTFWFPDAPDRPYIKRPISEAPSILLRPPTTALTYVLLPSAEQVFQRRAISGEFTAHVQPGLGSADVSWARDSDRISLRRAQAVDQSILIFGLGTSPVLDLNWARGPERPVLSRIKPDNMGSDLPFLAMTTATDLSWARGPDSPARRFPPQHVAAFTPQATTVTLSSWGWIPEARDRQANRVVSNAFVSALVPPAIVTAMPWGWIPEGPDRAWGRRAPVTHRDQEPVIPVPGQNLSWFHDQRSPLIQRARDAGFQVLAFPQVATYGWFPDGTDRPLPPRRATDAGYAALVVVPATLPQGWQRDSDAVPGPRRRPEGHATLVPPSPAQLWGWFVDAQQAAGRRLPVQLGFADPGRTAQVLPPWWFHQQVGPRPPGPVVSGAHVLPLGPVVLAPLSAISWLAQDPVRIRQLLSTALFIEAMVSKGASTPPRRGRFIVMVPAIPGDVFPVGGTD